MQSLKKSLTFFNFSTMHWDTNTIRKQFLDYFEGRGHKIVPSAPMVIKDDPTLMFTNAGMNQFKDVFLEQGSRPYSRAVDSQKCIRVSGKHNDLEEVGDSPNHHTFFEMLGNWSFGDYYKKEAIEWAWKLVTDVWKIDPARLYATVYEGDTRTELIVNGYEHAGGYDPLTGKELWRLGGGGDIPVPTPIVAHDLIILSSAHGGRAPLLAIRPGATGDITPADDGAARQEIAWCKPRDGIYLQTPIVYGGYLYACNALLQHPPCYLIEM